MVPGGWQLGVLCVLGEEGGLDDFRVLVCVRAKDDGVGLASLVHGLTRCAADCI